MQTAFTPEQLRDPGLARANEILRACVHCGMCTATCPTYQLLGDELDGPRGRIYLIKQMLESGRPADERTVKHIDRCLGCLACMTTCPSGVHYAHLVDEARAHIERTYRRPLAERALRWALAKLLPHPGRLRAALHLARLARPLRRLLPDRRLRAMLDLAPHHLPPPGPAEAPQTHAAEGTRRGRVALLPGCAQTVLDPEINAAAIRLLTRLGIEVVIPEGIGCCGSLSHHMGRREEAHAAAARTIRALLAADAAAPLDAVLVTASGCGTSVKDYGHMMRTTELAGEAAKVAGLARDVTEYLAGLDLPDGSGDLRVAYHAACSLQHGQQITEAPKRLLRAAGFEVVEPEDAHLCCGSAGTYNLLQPEISAELRDAKVARLEATAPEVIAAGNIGCLTQIASASGVPVVHVVELIDWATGGKRPARLGG